MLKAILRFERLAVFLVCAIGGPTSAQTAILENLVEWHQLAGVSVVTRCGEDISLEVHDGFKDIDDSLQIDWETKFRVASISKAVVALVTAKLAEQGTIDLEDAIGQYLEDEPFHPAHPTIAITLRHLLTHTSGIRDGSGYSGFLTETYAALPSAPALSAVLGEGGTFYTTDMWGSAAPGEYFHYANLNFGVLATVLEAASGMRFDQLMSDLLFSPYGLDAGFRVHDLQDVAQLAALYRQVDGAWVPQVDHLNGELPDAPDWSVYTPGTNAVGFAPQGGLRISARDLSVITRLWSHGTALGVDGAPLTFLGEAGLEALKAPRWSYAGDNGNNYYGLFNQWSDGLHLAASGLGEDGVIPDVSVSPFIGHPGEAYGLISDAYATPGGEWNVVFVTNGKWDGYSSGAASAFYQVEQDVFAAVREDLIGCLSSTTEDVQPDQWSLLVTPKTGDTLLVLQHAATEDGPIRCRLNDATGRLIFEGVAFSEGTRHTVEVSALQPGMHYLSIGPDSGPVSRFGFLVPH